MFRSAEDIILQKQTRLLPQDTLDVVRMRDANWRDTHQSIVTSVDWHPNGQVMLTSGLDKTLKLFNIDGKDNLKVQTMTFNDMPIMQSEFTPSGSEIILSGRRKYFYSFDVEKGKVTKIPGIQGRTEKSFEKFKISPCGKFISFLGQNGSIIQLSAKTKMPIATLTMNGNVKAIDYDSESKYLYSVGSM